jgi:hypothetical protein
MFFGIAKCLVSGLCSFSAVVSFASGGSTNDVWLRHIDAWQRQSLPDIVADYAPDARMVINNRVFTGRDEVQHVFSQLFKLFSNGVNQIDPPVVFDRFVYITWRFSPQGGATAKSHFGTDTFVVEDGLIHLQTIGSDLYDRCSFEPVFLC